MGIFWKCARIGERLSPYVSICCVLMAVGFAFLSPRSLLLRPWDADMPCFYSIGFHACWQLNAALLQSSRDTKYTNTFYIMFSAARSRIDFLAPLPLLSHKHTLELLEDMFHTGFQNKKGITYRRRVPETVTDSPDNTMISYVRKERKSGVVDLEGHG